MLFAAVHPLVHVNATLNAVAAVLLVVGLAMIKRGRVTAHKRVMLTAFGVSIAFLACYLWYHYQVGSVKFTHPGVVRYVYYTILLTHVLLAFTVPVLAIWTIWLGLRATGCCEPNTGAKGDSPLFAQDNRTDDSAGEGKKGTVPAAVYRARHRRLAHWTYPIWLYVSVTGVIVYLMLYHLWPPAGL
jgi:putative membrane protein